MRIEVYRDMLNTQPAGTILVSSLTVPALKVNSGGWVRSDNGLKIAVPDVADILQRLDESGIPWTFS